MNQIFIDDVDNVCRGCLSDKTETFQSLNEIETRNLFSECTKIQIQESDKLSHFICSICLSKCESWILFKKLCEQSEKALQEFLLIENTEEIFDNNESSEELHESNYEDDPEYLMSDVSQSQESFTKQNKDMYQEMENLYFNSASMTEKHLKITPLDLEKIVIPKKKRKESIGIDTSKNQRNKRLECSTCKQTFYKRDRLEAHIRSHLGQKPEICQICGKQFNNVRALRRHRTKHIDIKRYQCLQCPKVYKYATSLALHKKVHTNIRLYVCDLCGKDFVRSHGLQSHLLSHTTETPFPCDVCGKSFKNTVMLKNHQKRHEGIKNFICSECGKSFATGAELTVHSRSHTGDKPFSCAECSKSYKTKSHLLVHMRTHTGSKPYSCELCPKSFAHNKVLKMHRLTHTGERPHICEVCHRPFRQKSTLKVHMKIHKHIVNLRNGMENKQKTQTPIVEKETLIQNLSKQSFKIALKNNNPVDFIE